MLMAAPQENETILLAKQRVKGTGLALDDIESVMSQPWRSVYGERTNQSNRSLAVMRFLGLVVVVSFQVQLKMQLILCNYI